MLLNKIIFAVLVCICCGCVQKNERMDNTLLVKFKSRPGVDQLANLEKYIASKNDGQLSSIVIIHNELNKNEAFYIDAMIFSRYGFHSVLRFQASNNEHVSVLLEYDKNTEESCYQYSLSDFEWYKSSQKDIKKYIDATICDKVDNDVSTRM